MQEMSIPGNPLFDMGAVDILRARERGVPRYNEFRRQLGLKPIRTFDDLTDDTETGGADQGGLRRRRRGARPSGRHAWREGHRPTGFGFGETMFQIFILNASRRLQADRFYTDDYREEVYSKEGLAWVDASSFKNVILRHHPELASSGLGNVKNAFEPWDTSPVLSEERHPLRAFDPDLKKDPWTGDAARARSDQLMFARPAVRPLPLPSRPGHRQGVQGSRRCGRSSCRPASTSRSSRWHRSCLACSERRSFPPTEHAAKRLKEIKRRARLLPIVSQAARRRAPRRSATTTSAFLAEIYPARYRKIWPTAPRCRPSSSRTTCWPRSPCRARSRCTCSTVRPSTISRHGATVRPGPTTT